MLKYVSKFAMDILPSVVATIIGAYIVNHYIVTKPGADAPVAAAVSPADPAKAGARSGAKPSVASANVGNLPQPGVTAKGVSERGMLEKTAAERPTVVEKAIEKPAEKSADMPAETASIPVETHRNQPVPREKAVARSVPAPAVAPAPVVAMPNTTTPVEAAIPAEEHRDANELARAAIERLRGTGDASPTRPQEAARVPDGPRVAAAPAVSGQPIRPLPPPIMVSVPAAGTQSAVPGNAVPGSSGMRPYGAGPGIDDPNRPTPPADIPQALPSLPASGPLDLRADAGEPARRRPTVAEDMMLAAKSMFHAVLPKQLEPRSD
jgi:hypothetical protein